MSQHLDNSRRRLLGSGVGLALATLAIPAARAGQSQAAAAVASPQLEEIYQAIVDIEPAMELGNGPLGERRMVPITGGSFEGKGLKGKVLAGGADRQLIRADGVRELDAVYEMQTDDGAVISVRNRVTVHQQLPEGKRYALSHIELTAPAGPYAWLNDYVVVGTLQSLKPERQAVLITAYRVMPAV